ncbi:hypothetical protein ONZ45_g2609 [Pleurotus djamor]|nr:hypothetical protein ONZ45_g2609 [Pleurotus djamor]
MLPQHLASLVLFFSLLPHVLSISRNITIDDSLGDPATGTFIQYHPPDAWNDGRDCNACTAHPSESMLFRRTWTDSTFNRNPGSNSFPNTVLSASVTFNGTAVYVQCALARTRSSPTGDSDMTFLIDGQIAGAFARDAPGEDGYDYNVTVFSKTDLSPGVHSLVLLNGHVNGTKALVLLDSIIYTQDDGQPSSQPSSSSTTFTTTTTATPTSLNDNSSPSTPINVSVVLASVFGTLVLIILCVLAFLLHKRKRKPPHLNATPFVMPSMAEFSPRSTEDSWTSVYPESSFHRSSIYTFSNGRSTRSESSYPAPRRMSALYTIHSHSSNLGSGGGNDLPPAPTGRPPKSASASNGAFMPSDERNSRLPPAYGTAYGNLPGRS